MSGTKQFGWIEEATEGIDPTATGSTLINFGIQDEYDRPHPAGDQEIAGILQEGTKAFVDLKAGMKSVKIKHQFIYQHGWEWYYLLGKKVHTSGSTATNLDTITLGTLAANPIKSRTVYSRVGTDVIAATGCKTASFAVHLESPLPGQKPKPIWCDLELWGWLTATAAATVTAAPSYPAALANFYSKGVEQMSVITMDSSAGNPISLVNLQELTIGGKNTLAYHGGVLSTTPRGIEQLEGTKIFIEGLATMDFTANDMLARGRYDFANEWAPGATHSLVFTIDFSIGGVTYNHEIDLENVFIHALKPVVYKNKIEAYAFMGEVMAAGATEPITVKMMDGVEYQVT
jgi:hypothetical protein